MLRLVFNRVVVLGSEGRPAGTTTSSSTAATSTTTTTSTAETSAATAAATPAKTSTTTTAETATSTAAEATTATSAAKLHAASSSSAPSGAATATTSSSTATTSTAAIEGVVVEVATHGGRGRVELGEVGHDGDGAVGATMDAPSLEQHDLLFILQIPNQGIAIAANIRKYDPLTGLLVPTLL